MSQIYQTNTTIASGADVSGAIANPGGNAHLIGVLFPATMTNTAVTIQVELGGAWRDVYDELGVIATITVVDGLAIFPPWIAYGFPNALRLKGAVTEGAERTITIISRPL
jgi:hypothetical protein